MASASRFLIFIGVVLLLPLHGASAGPPADPCKKSGEIVTIDWDAIDAAVAEFGLSPEGEYRVEWLEELDECDGANNGNTSAILVIGNVNENRLNIDTDGLGTHLHWSVDLEDGNDWVYLLGTPRRDFFQFSTFSDGVGEFQTFGYQKNRSPNGDMVNVEWGGATGLGKPDIIGGWHEEAYSRTAVGGQTGPAKIPLLFKGGPGDDEIIGGRAGDTLLGNGGDDEVEGEGGKDTVKGGGGEDDCKGGPGKDKVKSCE